MPTPHSWPDKNTHDIAADEYDLLTPLEATIRLQEELDEIDCRLAQLDPNPATRSAEQSREYQNATARRELLSTAIDRHKKHHDMHGSRTSPDAVRSTDQTKLE